MKAFALLFFLLYWVSSASAITLVIAHEGKENPPYTYANKSDPALSQGVTIDVLNTIAKRLNFDIEYVHLPWLRALIKLKQNKVDALFHASFKQDRIKYGLYPMKNSLVDADKMLMTQRYILYKRVDSPLNWNGKSFTSLTGSLGAVMSYAIVSDLKKMGIKVTELSNSLALLNQVQSGRLAGFVNLENMTDSTIRKNKALLNSIEKIPMAVKEKPYYLMFSHGRFETHPELVEAIWLEINRTNRSGEYQEFLRKY